MEWRLKGYFRVQAINKLNEILETQGDSHGRIKAIKNKISIISKLDAPDYFKVSKCIRPKRLNDKKSTFICNKNVDTFSNYRPRLSKILKETYGNLNELYNTSGFITQASLTEGNNKNKQFFMSEIKKENKKQVFNKEHCKTDNNVCLPIIINKEQRGFHHYKFMNILEKKKEEFKQILQDDIKGYYIKNPKFSNNMLNDVYPINNNNGMSGLQLVE